MEIHTYGTPLAQGVVNLALPEKIPSSGELNFTVEVEESQPLDIWVTLQSCKDLKTLTPMIVQASNKRKNIFDVSYKIDQPLESGERYWLSIKAAPMHFHESEAVDSYFTRLEVE